ncbi:zinc finger protein 697-like [Hetaerina americana]|uniref:zinc finger protein 697-like n=1 Tax=Hetaerina americana TaxID=62018 RepID=UPI003A7F5B90
MPVVKEDDNPWLVCCTCVEKLTDFRLFKRRCVECLFVFYNRVQKGPYRGSRERKNPREETNDEKQQNEEDLEEGITGNADGLSAKAWEIDSPEGSAEPSDMIGTPEVEDPFSGIPGESPTTPGSGYECPEMQVQVKMEAIFTEDEEGGTRGLPEECLEIVEHKLEEGGDEAPVEWTGGSQGLVDDASGASDGEWSEGQVEQPAGEASSEAQGYQYSSLGCIQKMVHNLSRESGPVFEHRRTDQLSSPTQVEHGDSRCSESQVLSCAEPSLSVEPTPSGASQDPEPSGAYSTKVVCDDDGESRSFVMEGPDGGSTETAGPSSTRVPRGKQRNGTFMGARVSTDGASLLEQLFQCDQCGSEFLTKKAIQKHMSLHIGVGFLVCGVCQMKFKDRVEYERHGVLHHGVRVVGSEQFRDKSNDGSVTVASTAVSASPMGQIVEQITGATADKPFVCRICSKAFGRRGNLNVHMHGHTGWKPYSCDKCSSSFITRSSLNAHIRIHTGEKPYMCEICSKSFTTSSYHAVHMRLHSGDRPHACHLCPKAFISKNKLTLHMSVHTPNDKPYSCEFCPKIFAHKRTLILHTRIHTGDKSYACNLCSKSFTRKSYLTSHIKYRHGKKPHMCSICSKRFPTKTYLNRHLSTHKCESASELDDCEVSQP